MQGGLVKGLRFFGDFIGQAEVGGLEEQLRGVRYDRETLTAALEGVDLSEYFGAVSREDILALLCG